VNVIEGSMNVIQRVHGLIGVAVISITTTTIKT